LGVGVVLVALLASVVGVFAYTGAGAASPIAASAASGATGTLQATGPLTEVQAASSQAPPTTSSPQGTVDVVNSATPLDLSAPLTLTIGLKASPGLNSFATSLSNPASPEYRNFVSAGQLAAYGPGVAEYASLVQYFTGYGLTVVPNAAQLSLTVTGPGSAIEAAFHTTLSAERLAYHSSGAWLPGFGDASATPNSVTYGQPYVVNTGSLSLPASIAGAISGIVGLGGAQMEPALVMPQGMSPGSPTASTTNATAYTPQQNEQFNFFSSLDQIQNVSYGNFTWSQGNPYSFDCFYYGIGCGNFQTLYPSTMPYVTGAYHLWGGLSEGGLVAGGAPSTGISESPDLGQGITIALVEVGCAFPSDIASFSQQVYGTPYQLLNRVTQIAVNGSLLPGFTGYGYNNNLGQCELSGELYGWTLETMLDLEYASTMAPDAHIDLVAVPNAQFSSFDEAYALMAQYLTGGSASCGANFPSSLMVVSGGTNGACSVTIDSNSYGEGEMYQVLDGAPMYATVTNTLLTELNAVGVTNFFASGDSGGVSSLGIVDAFQSADAMGSTAVGGGQVTAADASGNVYPMTNSLVCDYVLDGNCYYYFGDPVTFVAQARELSSFTYWSYGEGLGGTYTGVVGGGFGQSQINPQPWWQNALDTFSSGSKVMPQLSNAAAFNMTIYAFGTWYENYGGTSFATPITAGEWALVEEQAMLQPAAKAAMGDINPLLFDVHNAVEAGVGTLVANGQPYADMTDMTPSGYNGDWNSYTWYYYNLSIQNPSAPYEPYWFAYLGNPAGPGWNYLQGLGMIQVNVMAADTIGATNAPYSLNNQPFTVMEKTSSGLVPITELTGGTTYTLEIVLADGGQAGSNYMVSAYSGGTNTGTYGGGTVTTITPNGHGVFTYTPTYTMPSYNVNATEYGYLWVQVANSPAANPEWSFQYYAVAEAPATGTLSLCVTDPQGTCQTGEAEVTMFTLAQTGYYNLWPQAYVTLNGQVQAEALVTQVAVNVSQYVLEDPTLPASTYAPGTLLGTYMSDERGSITFWGNPFVAENNGPLYPNVFTLTAHYGGLTSNTVTVFVEPQSGSFDPQLSANAGNTTTAASISGTVAFAGMKYVNWVNVSVGGSPGQYVNTTYPPAFYDSVGGIWESGVDAGIIPVDLTNLPSGASTVSIVAEGVNDLTFQYCFFGFCFGTPSVQNPMYWMDPMVYLPTHVSASATGQVTGTVDLTYAGASYPGAVGTLTLSWAGGHETLATGISGTYALNTAALADGAYTVTYTETAANVAVLSAPATVSFDAVNQASALSQEVSTLTAQVQADASTIAGLQSQVSSLEAGWASANATVASLQGQVAADQASLQNLQTQLASAQATIGTLESQASALSAQVSSLTQELAQAQGTVASLQQTIAQLEAGNAADSQTLSNLNAALNASQALVASLQGQLTTAQSTVRSDAAQIAGLQSQVAQLQQELNAKKTTATSSPLAWYQMPGAILGLLVVVAVAAGLVAYGATRRRSSRSGGAPESPETPSPQGSSMAGATASAAPRPSAQGRKAAQDEAMTELFRRSVVNTLQASIQQQKVLLAQGNLEDARRLNQEAHSLAFEVFGRQ
jgi:subtilase family serine protease